jgi:hypothetical protein
LCATSALLEEQQKADEEAAKEAEQAADASDLGNTGNEQH